MKSILSEFSIEKLKKTQFSYKEISNSVFSGLPPIYTFYPFKQYSKFSKKYSSLSIKVKLFDHNPSSLEILSKILYKIDTVEFKSLKEVPSWFTGLVINEYKDICEEWFEYLSSELYNFCTTNLNSKIQWNVFKSGVKLFKSQLTLEQKLWIHFNTLKDRNDERQFILDVRESLLPWMNTSLYNKVEQSEKNKRNNADYEVQKKEMFEQFQQNLHLKKPERSNLEQNSNIFQDQDLDIVE